MANSMKRRLSCVMIVLTLGTVPAAAWGLASPRGATQPPVTSLHATPARAAAAAAPSDRPQQINFKERAAKAKAWVALPLKSPSPGDANIPAQGSNFWTMSRAGFHPGQDKSRPTFDGHGLRFDIPAGHGEGYGGTFFARFIDGAGNQHYLNREGDEVWISFDCWVDTAWARTRFVQNNGALIGKKLAGVGAGPYLENGVVKAFGTSDRGKLILTTYAGLEPEWSDTFPQVYGYGEGLGDDSQAQFIERANDHNLQPRDGEAIDPNNSRTYVSYNEYQRRNKEGWKEFWVPPAARGVLTPNEKHTFQWHLKLGPLVKTVGEYRWHSMLVELWVSRKDKPTELAIRLGRGQWIQGQGIGQFILFTSLTNKSMTQQHPTAHVWYGNLIIAPQRIDDPVYEASPRPLSR
jgi:hypothetical protein